MRNVTLLTLMAAAALMLAACQDKPIEPMKPRVAVEHIQERLMEIQSRVFS